MRRNRKRRGTAILESALTLSVILTLTFGAMEFGYYFYVKNMLEGAAREACRAGIPPTGTSANATTAANNALSACHFPSGSVTVSITDTSGNAIAEVGNSSIGTQIEVTVSATWGTIGAGFRPMNLIGSSKTVSGVSVMRKEG